MDAIVKVEGITKHYKEFTLDHVSFQVPRGMILGLIGENGAGSFSGTIWTGLNFPGRKESRTIPKACV